MPNATSSRSACGIRPRRSGSRSCTTANRARSTSRSGGADHDRDRASLDARRPIPTPTPIAAYTARTTGRPCSSSIATTARWSSSCTRRSGSPTSPMWSGRCATCSTRSGSFCASRGRGQGRDVRAHGRHDDRRPTTRWAGPVPRSAVSPWRPTWSGATRPGTSSTSAYNWCWCGPWLSVLVCSTCSPARAASRSPPWPAARTSVDLIDVSGPALDTAERNLAHNRFIAVCACTVRMSTGDAFVEMERLRRREQRFDLVVVDPPSFGVTPDGRAERVAGLRPAHEVRGAARRGRAAPASRHARAVWAPTSSSAPCTGRRRRRVSRSARSDVRATRSTTRSG